MNFFLFGLIILSSFTTFSKEKCSLSFREYRINSGCDLPLNNISSQVRMAKDAKDCKNKAIELSHMYQTTINYSFTGISKPFHCAKDYAGPDTGYIFVDWEFNDGYFDDSNGSVNSYTQRFIDQGDNILGDQVFNENGDLLF